MNIDRAADELLSGLLAEPWGQVSASVYETGRLVSLAPWLTGHTERLHHLQETQNPDGGWGSADPAYALVPTLSAVEALLTTLRRSGTTPDGVESVAERGLRVLTRWLTGDKAVRHEDLPDLPAIELIVPSLIGRINRYLDGPLSPPKGMSDNKLRAVRSLVRSGAIVPRKLHHALEVVGQAAIRTSSVEPDRTGAVGASPAATAAWLNAHGPLAAGDASLRYLRAAALGHGGPVPCAGPITVFERSWVVSWLLRAGLRPSVPRSLAEGLTNTVGANGTAAAPGLPTDADTTAVVLYALALLGRPLAPDSLSAYELDTHFCTWQGEDGASVTTNAHVLEAFGSYVEARPETRADHAPAIRKVSAWLRGTQRPDGSWLDRWHVSPYYATACAAIALDRYGDGDCGEAVRQARQWLLHTQRPGGAWGIWSGTVEETAYALQTLLLTSPDVPREAVTIGLARLSGIDVAADGDCLATEPAMWHDKDLYQPTAIIRAAVLAALQLGQRLIQDPKQTLIAKQEIVANIT